MVGRGAEGGALPPRLHRQRLGVAMISQRLTAAILMSTAMTLVGSGVVASKVIAGGMHPFLAVPLRFLISTPIFIGLIYLTRTAAPRLTARQFMIVALQAAAGSAGYSILMIVALTMTTSASASVIHGLLPVLAALVATLALRERLSARLWVAIAAATSGALLVNFSSSNGMGFDVRQLMGNVFVVTAVSGEALFAILNKKIGIPLPPLYLAALMSGISLALTLPLALLVFMFGSVEYTGPALLATAYISVFPTVLGFWLWYSGSSRITGGEAAIFMSVLPVAALILSFLFLGEAIRPGHVAGIVLVLLGIAASVSRLSRRSS
ncbi:MAG: DMT family transporter [Mesorhizobium sp.]|nr:DMT family transporter [bacterium M00.F.Ca.ET.205.01.1.1]TGU50634.1 DMT family transporter [bacterium M00.F.Ca.ET.152.01.1.1]TGV34092.1 DMT family transporter [Mesorhizobium sp. M00.F.Ca.ET.186.01.1.1]TGZ40998.1 DMT family transporter [bacterium M00.F.Ca.ET.162.01.1.1]TJW32032.1 MAG: DMT family transporter [Mesorhizobium sp.]